MLNTGYLLLPLHRRDGSVRAHVIIDVADAVLAEHRWNLISTGYAQRIVGQRPHRQRLLLHRVILGLEPGDGVEVDHKNGDRLDCRRSNLRVATRALNAQNLPAVGGTSAHRGVSWDAARGKWQSYAKLNRRKVYLGRFDDEREAARVARDWRLAHMPFTNEARTAHPG